MKQIDFISLARDDSLDLVIAAEECEEAGSLTTDEGDDALRRDLEELLFTPMYTRLYEPFWGHRFTILTHAPEGPNILMELRHEWRRLMEREDRVDPTTATVTATEEGYIFSVKSNLTGELISLRRK